MRIVKNGGFSICSFNDELRVEKGQSQLTTLLVTLIFKAKINVEIDVFGFSMNYKATLRLRHKYNKL